MATQLFRGIPPPGCTGPSPQLGELSTFSAVTSCILLQLVYESFKALNHCKIHCLTNKTCLQIKCLSCTWFHLPFDSLSCCLDICNLLKRVNIWPASTFTQPPQYYWIGNGEKYIFSKLKLDLIKWLPTPCAQLFGEVLSAVVLPDLHAI